MTTTVAPASADSGFDAALANRTGGPLGDPAGGGSGRWLMDTSGRCVPLPVHRWHGLVEPAAQAVVHRCTGPTVDLGCGPGRLTTALAGRGIASLGVDISAVAVRLTCSRGGAALRRDVFASLPGEGRWSHVLLMDGNIGIGGDPSRLLRRCARLLRPGGTGLVELDPPGTGLWRGQAYVAYGDRERPAYRGPSFRWARLGVGAVDRVAAETGLAVRAVFERDGRWFAELVRQ